MDTKDMTGINLIERALAARAATCKRLDFIVPTRPEGAQEFHVYAKDAAEEAKWMGQAGRKGWVRVEEKL